MKDDYNYQPLYDFRAQVRGQKLKAVKDDEKKKLAGELSDLDKDLEATEAELTKLQLLAQEVGDVIE